MTKNKETKRQIKMSDIIKVPPSVNIFKAIDKNFISIGFKLNMIQT